MAQRKPKGGSSKPVQATRVDPPHVPASELPPSTSDREGSSVEAPLSGAATPQAASATATCANDGVKAVAIVEQVRRQAGQLSDHLRRQQATLDHRESELNSRSAAIEKEIRSARLWLSERQQKLEQERADVARQHKELDAKQLEVENKESLVAASEGKLDREQRELLKRLTDREAEVEHRQRQLDAQSKQIADREEAIERHSEELRRREENLSGNLTEVTTRSSQVDQLAHERAKQNYAEHAALEARRANLEAAENLLAREQSALFEQRRQIAVERTQLQHMIDAERKKLESQQAHANIEDAKREKAWQERQDALEARTRALEQLRSEVARAQEEALELRLATEELWARLCGTMAPAALTQSIAQLRQRLAEQHTYAEKALADQRAELATLSARLSEQHEKLATMKHDFQAWAALRHQEIERQAELLVGRERQLDEQETDFAHRERVWQEERASLQQEIRRLLAQLRRPATVAA